ncbi:MAG: phosphoribosyltransferase family protein [Actinomycetota bacterium]
MAEPTLRDTLDSLHTAWAHDGAAADAVRALKYGRSTVVVSVLADELAMHAPAVDLVTWCPASRSRRRERGFDQSELLARAVAHRIEAPARPTLVRVDRSPQTTRGRAGRLSGPRLRLRRRPGAGSRVLLIDDVATTGATLCVAARLLREGGAAAVHGLVVTRARRRSPGAR